MFEFDVTRLDVNVSPISLLIIPREIDEGAFLFRAIVHVEVHHSSGVFRYEADDIWFTGDLYSSFEKQLKGFIDGSNSNAVFSDPSNYFRLGFSRKDNDVIFDVSVIESYVGSTKGEARLIFTYMVNNDFLCAFANHLQKRS